MSDFFYRAFEDKYRGARELILSRLDVYRSLVAPFGQIYPESKGLDIGCGRGEWLEVLRDEGIDPVGVDLDEGMLEVCRALQLPVVKDDAVSYLRSQPDESLVVVSAFHVVEHLSFDRLQLVISEAFRVLKPGGLLILETPNPENITVGTSNFYLDPSHERPIPSALLSFLVEYAGFSRHRVWGLQESPSLLKQSTLGIFDVLAGVSPDYAVIAQKDALSTIFRHFDDSFSQDHGFSLKMLSGQYDAGIRGAIKRIETRQNDLQAQVAAELKSMAQAQQQELEAQMQTHVHQHLHRVAVDVQTLQQAFHGLRSEYEQYVRGQQDALLHSRLFQAELRAQRAELELKAVSEALIAVRSSTFWRLLGPLRWCAIQLKLLVAQGPMGRLRALRRKLGSSEVGIQSEPRSSSDFPAQLEASASDAAPTETAEQDSGVPSSPAEPVSTRVAQIRRGLERAIKHPDGPR